jgi:hypothetical protein
MAGFKKKSNNTITLISNGSIQDSHKVARWARELMNTCDAIPVSKEQAFILSAAHRTDYAPNSVILSFNDYFFSDISHWLKMCKNRK